MEQRPTEQTSSPGTATAQQQQFQAQLDGMRREQLAIRVRLAEMPDDAKELAALRQRYGVLEEQIRQTQYELERLTPTATPAGTPAATTSPAWVSPPPLPNEYVLLGALFMVVTFLPLSIAFARRIWRRNEADAVALSPELEGRLHAMQAAVESVAVEVERIGEAQRFTAGLLHSQIVGPTQDSLVPMPEAVAKRDMRNAVTPH